MDDLISRAQMSEAIKDYLKGLITKGIHEVEITEFNVDVQNIIEAQPKAYNVDKVVEQINEVLQDLNVLEIMCHLDSDSTIQNDLDNFLQAIKNEISRRLKAGADNG